MTTATEPRITHTEEALVDRIFGAAVQSLELFSIYLGKRLGLYDALRRLGSASPTELAGVADVHPRYAREWLEQQAVAGLIEVDDVRAPAEARRYSLPPGTSAVLTEPAHPMNVLSFADAMVGLGAILPRVADAYRSGGGIPFSDYGADIRNAQGGLNRPAFTHELTGAWLPAVPDIHEALGRGIRVAEVGSGQGWASIALAKAYPASTIIGLDLDHASVADARRFAAEAGVSPTFIAADGASLAEHGPYDLAFIFESLHDMSRPDNVLAAVRQSLTPGGSLIVMDERVQDEFTAPGDEVERMMYGWSITWCLVNSMAEQPSLATGTVLRRPVVEQLAAGAGFASCEVLPIESDFFRFYRMRT